MIKIKDVTLKVTLNLIVHKNCMLIFVTHETEHFY